MRLDDASHSDAALMADANLIGVGQDNLFSHSLCSHPYAHIPTHGIATGAPDAMDDASHSDAALAADSNLIDVGNGTRMSHSLYSHTYSPPPPTVSL
jgi:hypothetical protein